MEFLLGHALHASIKGLLQLLLALAELCPLLLSAGHSRYSEKVIADRPRGRDIQQGMVVVVAMDTATGYIYDACGTPVQYCYSL